MVKQIGKEPVDETAIRCRGTGRDDGARVGIAGSSGLAEGRVGLRAGAHALSILALPLNAHVLDALADGPRTLIDIRRAAGSPPPTTMRGHLRALEDAGIIERRRRPDFPASVDIELAKAGAALIPVSQITRAWVQRAPTGPIELGTPTAKSVIKALVDGWTTGIVRILAVKPHSLTELSRLITELSYPSLERRLGAMRLAALIEPSPGSGRGTQYRVTAWLRQAIAPLALGARWERAHAADRSRSIRRFDVESALLLALPAVALPADLSGTCRLAVEMRQGGELRPVGVTARVEEGRVVLCRTRLGGEAGAWVSGSTGDWMRAVIRDDKRNLEVGGDCDLVAALLDGIHRMFSTALELV